MPRKYDFRKECQKEAHKLLIEMKRIALNPSLRKPAVKLGAINSILDRAYGKPNETIDDKRQPRIIEIIHAASAVHDGQGSGIPLQKMVKEKGTHATLNANDVPGQGGKRAEVSN